MTQATATSETRLTLSPEQQDWAERVVGRGRAGSVEEAVLSAVDMAMIDEVYANAPGEPWTLETLRAAIQAGVDSGPPVPVDIGELRRRGVEYLRELGEPHRG